MTDPSGQSPTSRVCISNPVLSFLGPFISGLGQKSSSGALAHASLSGDEGKILKTFPHSDLLPKTSPLWALLHTSLLHHLRVCKKCQSPFVQDSLHSKMTLTCEGHLTLCGCMVSMGKNGMGASALASIIASCSYYHREWWKAERFHLGAHGFNGLLQHLAAQPSLQAQLNSW